MNHAADLRQGSKRAPLKESSKSALNSNAAPRKSLLDQKLDLANPALNESMKSLAARPVSAKKQSNRMTGAELKDWQQSWRKILKASVVYFENDEGRNEKEKERAKLALQSLGATIERFFSENVTIIVSRRPYHKHADYPMGDIFRIAKRNELKVWTYEKVFRFMNHLGEPIPEDESFLKKKLSSLLKNEKLFGPNDRDPNAKRDDIKYFTGYYFYVYDLRQQTRPIVVKEWPTNAADFPKLTKSTNGRSLFIEDTHTGNSEKRHKRRIQYLEETKDYRQKIIEASCLPHEPALSYEERVQYKRMWEESYYGAPIIEPEQKKRKILEELNENSEVLEVRKKPMAPPANLYRDDSTIEVSQNKVGNEYGEIEASGVVQTQSGSNAISGQGYVNGVGNGLGPSHSLVFNKKIANEKKKMMTFAPLPAAQRKESPLKVFKVRKEDRVIRVINVKKDSKFISSEDARRLSSQAKDSNGAMQAPDMNKNQEESKTPDQSVNISFGPALKQEEECKPRLPQNKITETPADNPKLNDEKDDLMSPINNQLFRQSLQPKQKKVREITNFPPVRKSKTEAKPGYCENCRVKYDDFDEHILMDKHRHFATNDDNFKDIDRLIEDVRITRLMGL
ncbi:hypothetical protein KL933_001523 [Ogataea haglerorum]|uniref:DBF4-type domain-containing protein n=1 Tax=Ogataea haglerorum TaxID=1937702 RepID=A0AAN6D9F9_9ASCO|nr:uncharacterized protein KL911_002177 [Ogataea haglerorum]KAG7707700.1 hypothetical protein KL914_002521 [Ogataea haglerorum]KAG7719815.1 hypothetical protein KL913_001784 [Ogataea haglerorum]KAG7721662.1 hypothetical protein KL949_001394 [Ogataea haglerorum]KAG7729297.1 hypothetical protein KL933_001523 [Ogataea haglerorum]KAG7732124.1 hypothetical protein KL948_002322 [Ogataea haglerorum]